MKPKIENKAWKDMPRKEKIKTINDGFKTMSLLEWLERKYNCVVLLLIANLIVTVIYLLSSGTGNG